MSSRDHEYTVKIAEIALEKIKSLSLPADPSSYELWYNYAVGRNPDLNRRINRAVDENGGLPMSEVDGIYNEFMGLSRTRTELKNLSENVSGEIDNVVGILGELILSASESRDNWAEASTRLVDPRDQNTLRAIADALIKSLRAVELKCTALEQRLNASAQEVELLKQALSAVTVEASLDPVTGLPNRRRFDDALEQAIAGANGDGRPFCLLMIDIDHFKRFNDCFGHLMGDSVLSLIGAMLKQSIKVQDTVARYGGEEFTVILPNASLSGATALAEQIRGKIMRRELKMRSSGEYLGTITVSIGVAEFRSGERAWHVVERADTCLYEAKRAGRNCTRYGGSGTEMRGDAA